MKSQPLTLTQKLLKLSVLSLTAGTLSWTVPVLANADTHCACDTKCMDNCAKGDTQKCGCKTCSCAKGKACSHDKCTKDHHHDEKHEEAKSTAAPAKK